MDPDEISKLCARLRLDERDGLMVQMDQNLYAGGKEKMELCLVGNVLGNNMVNKEGMGEILKQIWRTSHHIRVEELGSSNLFAFHFDCKEDR